jgi:outer membrane receptor protein involved in Fe transport
VSAATLYTGRTPMLRDATSGVVTSWRDAFLRADLRLAYRLPGGLELAAGADNVFDRRPAEWAGFAGRHFYTSVTWTVQRTHAPEDR